IDERDFPKTLANCGKLQVHSKIPCSLEEYPIKEVYGERIAGFLDKENLVLITPFHYQRRNIGNIINKTNTHFVLDDGTRIPLGNVVNRSFWWNDKDYREKARMIYDKLSFP